MQKIPVKVTLTVALFSALAGCGSMPGVGPTRMDVVSQQNDEQSRKYELIDIDERSVGILNSFREPSLSMSFGDRRPPKEPMIGIGDSISVTIWEAGGGGLFSSPVSSERATTGSNSATVPELVVGRDGSISVPYAGRINVAGRTPQAVQKVIEDKLAGKAVDPQVVVNVTKALSNAVTVNGDVTNGARVPLSVRGDRILDVIATAGGIRSPVNETYVLLTRGGKVAVTALSDIVATPNENIYLRPDDTLTLIRQPKIFFAYGATGKNEEIPFNSDRVSVGQAMAKAGGLIDQRADPAGVFIIRYEREQIVRQLRPDSPLLGTGEPFIPVAYRLNLRETNGLFLAQIMHVQNRDLLFVSNAPLADLGKAMQAFNGLTAPALGAAAIAIAAR